MVESVPRNHALYEQPLALLCWWGDGLTLLLAGTCCGHLPCSAPPPRCVAVCFCCGTSVFPSTYLPLRISSNEKYYQMAVSEPIQESCSRNNPPVCLSLGILSQCSLLCLQLTLLPVHILILSPSLFCGQFFLCTLIFLSTHSCWTTSSSVLGALDSARTWIVLWGCQGVNTEADFPWPVVAGTEHFLHVFSFSLHVDQRRWLVLIPHFKYAEADINRYL